MKGDMNTRHFKAFWQMESTNQRDGSFGLLWSVFTELLFTNQSNPQTKGTVLLVCGRLGVLYIFSKW